MFILVVLVYAFALCCIGAIAFSIVLLVRACRRLPADAKVAAAFGVATVIGATAFAAYWAWLIIVTCPTLLFKDESLGPFGALAFPFWACIAVTPALLGYVVFSWLARRLAPAG